MLSFLSGSLLGHIIGNIVGIIRLVRKHEQPLWTSKFYFQYVPHNKYSGILFAILWCLLACGIGAVFLLVGPGINGGDKFSAGFSIIPSFFFVTGFLLLMELNHYLDKLHMFSDRIEIRFLFHAYKIIEFADVELIARSLDSAQKSVLIYRDKDFGLFYFGGGPYYWQMPPSLFTENPLKIDTAKLHRSLRQPLTEANVSLPKEPLLNTPIDFKAAGVFKRVFYLSILIINPYTFLIVATSIFGLFYASPIALLLFDFSTAYAKNVLRSLLSSGKINPKYFQ